MSKNKDPKCDAFFLHFGFKMVPQRQDDFMNKKSYASTSVLPDRYKNGKKMY